MFNQTSITAAFGRVLLALIFLISGLSKIAAPATTQGYIVSAHIPFPILAFAIAVVIEVGGGVFLVLGFKTRMAAIAMAVFSLATALGFHNQFSDLNQMMHFLKNVAIAGGLLQVVAFGAGDFSVDGRIAKRRREAPAGALL